MHAPERKVAANSWGVDATARDFPKADFSRLGESPFEAENSVHNRRKSRNLRGPAFADANDKAVKTPRPPVLLRRHARRCLYAMPKRPLNQLTTASHQLPPEVLTEVVPDVAAVPVEEVAALLMALVASAWPMTNDVEVP